MDSTTVKRTLSLSVVIGTTQTRRQEGASESIILVQQIDADDEKIVVAHVPLLARWDSPRRSSRREHLFTTFVPKIYVANPRSHTQQLQLNVGCWC